MVQITRPDMKLHSIKGELKEEYKMENQDEHIDIIHEGISCDGCGCECIVGTRYKCAVCQNFDYCEKCMKEHASEHDHPFVKIYHPKMKLATLKVVVDEDCPTYIPPVKIAKPEICEKPKSDKLKSYNKNAKQVKVDYDGPVHMNVTCDGCGAYPICGIRYKCAICPNFDFCEKCEEKFHKEHSHPMLQISNPKQRLFQIKCNLREKFKMDNNNEQVDIIHDGISCDGCGCECIVGNRYKCAVCQNFDYCEKCMKEHASEHDHPFIKIYHPKMKLASIKIVIGEECPTYDNSNSKKVKLPKQEEEEKKTPETEEKPIHKGITCDGCGISPIVGCRYKCAVCQNFDFCEVCEEKHSEEHQHPFIKIYNPSMKLAAIKCVVREDCPVYQKDK